jgi:lysophospholipase L1-like esterase
MNNYIIGIVLLTATSCKKIDVVEVGKREGHMALTTSVLFERKVIIEGDSWSSKTTPAIKWPYFLKDSSWYFAHAPVINYARPGDNVAWMVEQYDTTIHLSRPTKRTDDYWLFVYAGINDLMGLHRPADTIYANLKKIWVRARADGYKVVAFTVCYSLNFVLPSQEPERLKLNEMIKSSRLLWDKCIDMAAVFDPRTTPEWFTDATHLTWDGHKKFAGVVAEAFKNQLFLKGGKVLK